jgi:tetratricopeptide (TPR) repeat protein
MSHDWERLKDLLARALELDGPARQALLDAETAADPALRAEVEALLAADARTGPVDVLQSLVSRSTVARIVKGPEAGDRVGSYRIVRKIGEGGMGVVYEAERADPELRQRVALKLVHVAFGGRDLFERFLVERQILARLEHPNIARFLDGGLTDDDLPYYAMEYVEGTRIDRYCDARGLDLRKRLQLFQRVCQAVQYAHQNLIVHRDIKPDNVLVCADGTPKLLDFGIAKLLSVADPDGGAAPGTRTAGRRLTLEYASPEQIRGGTITPASDVYALAVLLYALLAGRSPYRNVDALPHELEHEICDIEPPRPSEAARTGRSNDPTARRLARALTGDLDTIVMKALRKEPALRYAMAGQMADDVGRHLSGLPVLARPDTLAYRARKFVRRHAVGVAAASLVVASLIGGLGVALRQAKIAARERDNARSEAAKAQQVSEFLVGLFRASDPSVALGEDVSALTLLERGAARLEDEGELRDQPDVRATMLHVTSRVFKELGRYDRAAELAQQALDLRTAAFGPTSPEVAQTLTLLGSISHERGDPETAEAFHRRAVAINQRLFAPGDSQLENSLKGLALAWQVEGKYHEADSLWNSLLASARVRFGPRSQQAGETLHSLGWARLAAGDYAAAESSFREALAIRRALRGNVHPEVAHTAEGLAQTLHNLGRLDEAEQLAREALATETTVLGDKHPNLANDEIALAGILAAKGQADSAEAHYRAALAVIRDAAGGDDLRAGRIMNDLAGVVERRSVPLADSLYRQAWRIYRAKLGDAHPFTGVVLGNVAATTRRLGDLAGSQRLYAQALTTLRAAWGDDHVETAGMSARLAYVMMERGDLAEAEPLMQAALATLQRQLPPAHPRVVLTLEALVSLYDRWGKTDSLAAYRSRLAAARAAGERRSP